MISGQDQNIGDNSYGIQAKNDVHITNNGLTISQMGEIMIELQRLFVAFTAEARETAEQRLDQFRSEMMERFSEPDSANPEAFKEPDFQFLYNKAQEHYARDGNELTSSLLVELLAERSKVPQRDRIALMLNEATDKIAKLTDEDVSILSLLFAFTQVSFGANNYDTLVNQFKRFAVPFIKDIKPESSAYGYLEALGCVSVNQFGGNELGNILFSSYDLIFTKRFELSELYDAAGHSDKDAKLLTYLVKTPLGGFQPFGGNSLDNARAFKADVSQRFEYNFAFNNSNVLRKRLVEDGFEDKYVNGLIEFLNSKKEPEVEAIKRLSEDVPELGSLLKLWPKLFMQRCSLTSVGVVIGHASLSKCSSDFNAPLSTWIK